MIPMRRAEMRWWSVCEFLLVIIIGSTQVCAEELRYNPLPPQIIQDRIRKFGGDDRQRELTLKQLFTEAGCAEHLSEQAVKGSNLPNVVCVLPGTSEQTIIVGAHFDHVAAGDGVVDNWSGAALLPSLYEAAKMEPRKHSYIFGGFTDEEKGEVGSRFYARRMSDQQVSATDAMVNLDTLGLGPTKVWSSHSDKALLNVLGYIAQKLNVPVQGVNVERVGTTDSEQFAARNIPSVTIHSLTQETWTARILHGPKDKLSAMRLDDYYQTYRLVAAYIALLDQVPRPRPGSQKSH
jgi:Zn-dependent M28 family amino/carboxypeptidase